MTKVSDRYIWEPSLEVLEADLIVALKCFRVSVLRRWVVVKEKRTRWLLSGGNEEGEEKQDENVSQDKEGLLLEEEEEKGWGTGLRDKSGNSNDHDDATREVNAFLMEVER